MSYHLHHVLPLALVTASSSSEARRAIQAVVQLYEERTSRAHVVPL
jgi:predicted component of type VI protein secretion system